jgi:hypothetical protein
MIRTWADGCVIDRPSLRLRRSEQLTGLGGPKSRGPVLASRQHHVSARGKLRSRDRSGMLEIEYLPALDIPDPRHVSEGGDKSSGYRGMKAYRIDFVPVLERLTNSFAFDRIPDAHLSVA